MQLNHLVEPKSQKKLPQMQPKNRNDWSPSLNRNSIFWLGGGGFAICSPLKIFSTHEEVLFRRLDFYLASQDLSKCWNILGVRSQFSSPRTKWNKNSFIKESPKFHRLHTIVSKIFTFIFWYRVFLLSQSSFVRNKPGDNWTVINLSWIFSIQCKW